MWARRCGAPPGSPSQVKVLIQSFMTGAIGFAVYQYMSGADLGYLDLGAPVSEQVLCVTRWPLRHSAESFFDPEMWQDWADYREDLNVFVREHQCDPSQVADLPTCSTITAPVSKMGRNLGIPLVSTGSDYWWGNDAIETYGYWFLWMTILMWAMVTIHDVALLTLRNRDFVLDLKTIRSRFPCWKKLWILVGFRCWKRLARGRGIKWGDKHFVAKPGRVIAYVAAPLFIVWALIVFHIVVLPVVTLFFLCFPIRLSRVLIFLNSLASGILGVMLTVHCLIFMADISVRQQYAVTWPISEDPLMPCYCGCVYPLSFGRCTTLMLIGVVVAYKAFTLAFRCLKGLRRSNWANLMSVLFPVPLTIYEVYWTQPDGKPIEHRTEGVPVQGELAFDPFALMDEQPESGRTTLTLVPTAIHPENEPVNWSVDDVCSYLEELGLEQHCDAFQRHGIDGPTLIDILRSGGGGLSELGLTSELQISKVRGRLLMRTKRFLPQEQRGVSGSGSRKMAGPSPIGKELPRKKAHLEYIGCCGFPCLKGEHSGKVRYEDMESEGESNGATPKADRDALTDEEAVPTEIVGDRSRDRPPTSRGTNSPASRILERSAGPDAAAGSEADKGTLHL